jgi:hypothetical protein
MYKINTFNIWLPKTLQYSGHFIAHITSSQRQLFEGLEFPLLFQSFSLLFRVKSSIMKSSFFVFLSTAGVLVRALPQAAPANCSALEVVNGTSFIFQFSMIPLRNSISPRYCRARHPWPDRWGSNSRQHQSPHSRHNRIRH